MIAIYYAELSSFYLRSNGLKAVFIVMPLWFVETIYKMKLNTSVIICTDTLSFNFAHNGDNDTYFTLYSSKVFINALINKITDSAKFITYGHV